MACRDLPDVPDLEIPKIPDLEIPPKPSFQFNPPTFGLPGFLTNFHPNVFDILILLWLIWQGRSFGSAASNSDKQDALESLNLWLAGNQTESGAGPVDTDATSIEVYAVSPFVRTVDLNSVFDMINRQYDDPDDSTFEIIFGDKDLGNLYKNKFKDYNFNGRKLTRV